MGITDWINLKNEIMKNFFKKVLKAITGLGYWGISLVGYGIVAAFLGFWNIAFFLWGGFLFKNLQAIKEDIKTAKW